MRRLLTLLCLMIAFAQTGALASHHRVSASVPGSAATLPLFGTETAAQGHCPADQVVWLNTNSGVYHEKGMRWYGTTHFGAYVCRKEADAAGDRDTRNGQ